MKMTLKAFAASAIAVAASITLMPQALAAQVAAPSPLELRSGPGPDYDVVGNLGAGTVVNVLWCGTKQSWCLIKRRRIQGWVLMKVLQPGGPNAADSSAAAALFPSTPADKLTTGGVTRKTVEGMPPGSLTDEGGGTASIPGSTIGGLQGLGGNMTPTGGGTVHVLGH